MNAIDYSRAAIAVGVGLGDELITDWDENVTPARTESFRTAKDLWRLGASMVGYGLQVFQPRYAKFGDTLATAATPLLVKSVWTAVAAARAVEGTGKQRYVPREKQAARERAARAAAARGNEVSQSISRDDRLLA